MSRVVVVFFVLMDAASINKLKTHSLKNDSFPLKLKKIVLEGDPTV